VKNNKIALSILCLIIAYAGAGLESAPRLVEKENGKTWHVIVDKIPGSLDEFKNFRDRLAVTPQGGIAVYLTAQIIMIDRPELGEQCLILCLDQSRLNKSGSSSKRPAVEGWTLGGSEIFMLNSSGFVNDKKYAAKSFVSGTKTADAYSLPVLPWTFIIRVHSFQDRDPLIWKGHASTSCHDLGYVPLHVKKNNRGIWKMFNSSSFYSGCIDPPAKQAEDDL
jgi:hypothetical protein